LFGAFVDVKFKVCLILIAIFFGVVDVTVDNLEDAFVF
jgi:hypothetical protein